MKQSEKVYTGSLNTLKPALNLLAAFALLTLTACGGGGGGGGDVGGGGTDDGNGVVLSTDASLSDLQLSNITLDQVFQTSQTSYTASAGFLIASVQATATLTDSKASLTINGVAANSDTTSAPISLAEGDNTINIVVTAEDGVSTQTYSIDVTRQLAVNFAQSAYLKAINAGAGDLYGTSVALDGDTLVVGAPSEDGGRRTSLGNTNNNATNSGAVYVFTRDINGVWTAQALLKAGNADPDDQFGTSVALDGDTLAVGAMDEAGDASSTTDSPNNNAFRAGAVYVFTRSGTSWTQQAYLKAGNAGREDRFGSSVALSGDTLAVGVSFEAGDENSTAESSNDNAERAGAVYIFTRTDTSWTQQAYLKAKNAQAFDQFGASVALFGDTLAVGARLEAGDASSTTDSPNNNEPGAGAAYVFTRSGTSWTEQAYLKASNAARGDNFGSSIALSGDTMVVGAPFEDGVASTSGAVYVFTGSGASWKEQAYLKASNVGNGDRFGSSVALSGDTLVVGARFEDGDANSTIEFPNNDAPDAGAVYVFTRSDTSWSQQAYIKASNVGGGDEFGTSVTLSGDTVVVGAPQEGGNANSTADSPNDNTSLAGAVYVFQ